MKKIVVIFILIIAMVFALTGCQIIQPKVTSIEMDANGEPIVVDGELVLPDLIVSYSNGTDKAVKVTADMMSSEDLAKLNTTGTHTISVNYQGETTSFEITIKGEKGDTGDKGEQGAPGEKGDTGEKGDDGIGIRSTVVNELGELIITLTDGTVCNAGKVTGENGVNGTNGVGISSVTINENGQLVIVYTNNTRSTMDIDVRYIPSTAWYYNNPNASSFEIDNLKEFLGLKKLVTEGTQLFEGKTINLTADIDLSKIDWTPIGGAGTVLDATKTFKGTFDGNGHVITNLTINTDATETSGYVGLFASTVGATIKNVKLYGVDITAINTSAAGVVGCAVDTVIENVIVNGEIKALNAGGIVYMMKNYVNEAYSGEDETYVKNCVSNVDITIYSQQDKGVIFGGIAGQFDILLPDTVEAGHIESLFVNCKFTGVVNVDVSIAPDYIYGGQLVGTIAPVPSNLYSVGIYGFKAYGKIIISDKSVTDALSNISLVGYDKLGTAVSYSAADSYSDYAYLGRLQSAFTVIIGDVYAVTTLNEFSSATLSAGANDLILLMSDISTETYQDFRIKCDTQDKKFTIDLNGYAFAMELDLVSVNTSSRTYTSTYGRLVYLPYEHQMDITIKDSSRGNTGSVGLDSSDCWYSFLIIGASNMKITLKDINAFANYGGFYTNGNCANDAELNATNCTFSATNAEGGGAYLAGDCIYNFKNCTFNGYSGIHIKSGTLNLTNCTLNGSGAYAEPLYFGNGGNLTGDALTVECTVGYEQHLAVTINGGTFNSAHAYGITEAATANTGIEIVDYATVNIIENPTYNAELGARIRCTQVSSEAELTAVLSYVDNDIVKEMIVLRANITLTENVTYNKDLLILLNDYTLDGQSYLINGDVYILTIE